MENKTVKVNIRGRVQGVFFRAFTRDEAVLRQLTGYVRNCSDGSVEALFQGPSERVEDMLSWCWQGSPHSKVDGVTSNQSEFQRDLSDFKIRY